MCKNCEEYNNCETRKMVHAACELSTEFGSIDSEDYRMFRIEIFNVLCFYCINFSSKNVAELIGASEPMEDDDES